MNLMPRTLNLLAAGLLTLAFTGSAIAQNAESKPAVSNSAESNPERRSDFVVKTYYLRNIWQQNDANEVLIAARNVLDRNDKLYLVASENAIVLDAPPDQQAVAQRIINDLDRPRKSFRLTFTLADSDAGKRVGVQHFSIIVAAGQRTILKQGSKVPVMTGSYDTKTSIQQTQFTYIDIGMNFDVTLSDSPGGLLLKAKVEDSSVARSSEYGNSSGPLAQEPIVNQTSLEGTSIVTPGKPLTLGSVDVAGSTRHIDIEVVAEPIS